MLKSKNKWILEFNILAFRIGTAITLLQEQVLEQFRQFHLKQEFGIPNGYLTSRRTLDQAYLVLRRFVLLVGDLIPNNIDKLHTLPFLHIRLLQEDHTIYKLP